MLLGIPGFFSLSSPPQARMEKQQKEPEVFNGPPSSGEFSETPNPQNQTPQLSEVSTHSGTNVLRCSLSMCWLVRTGLTWWGGPSHHQNGDFKVRAEQKERTAESRDTGTKWVQHSINSEIFSTLSWAKCQIVADIQTDDMKQMNSRSLSHKLFSWLVLCQDASVQHRKELHEHKRRHAC